MTYFNCLSWTIHGVLRQEHHIQCLNPVFRLDWALFIQRWNIVPSLVPSFERFENVAFYLPPHFPAPLIIFWGRGGKPPFPEKRGRAGSSPFPKRRGGEPLPSLRKGPCGVGRPSLVTILRLIQDEIFNLIQDKIFNSKFFSSNALQCFQFNDFQKCCSPVDAFLKADVGEGKWCAFKWIKIKTKCTFLFHFHRI